MVFALLCAAIVWNLGTWYFGLPSSSSHTLVGSIIGVGLTNQLLATHAHGTSGVDWAQAIGIGQSLFVFANHRVRRGCTAAAGREMADPRARPVSRAGRAAAAAFLGPIPVCADLHRR